MYRLYFLNFKFLSFCATWQNMPVKLQVKVKLPYTTTLLYDIFGIVKLSWPTYHHIYMSPCKCTSWSLEATTAKFIWSKINWLYNNQNKMCTNMLGLLPYNHSSIGGSNSHVTLSLKTIANLSITILWLKVKKGHMLCGWKTNTDWFDVV